MELAKYLEKKTLAQVGFRRLVSVTPDASIDSVLETMSAEKVGCVVVADGLTMRGIFTERDVILRVLGKGLDLSTPVQSVMTPDPVTAGESEPVGRVFGKMHKGGFRHLPVVNKDGEPLGTVSIKRVVSFIADHYFDAIHTLPPEPHQYPTAPEGA